MLFFPVTHTVCSTCSGFLRVPPVARAVAISRGCQDPGRSSCCPIGTAPDWSGRSSPSSQNSSPRLSSKNFYAAEIGPTFYAYLNGRLPLIYRKSSSKYEVNECYWRLYIPKNLFPIASDTSITFRKK